jgi:hypothetical protein
MSAPLRIGSVVVPSEEGIRRFGGNPADVGIVVWIDKLSIAVARFDYRTIWRGHRDGWKRADRSARRIWIEGES